MQTRRLAQLVPRFTWSTLGICFVFAAFVTGCTSPKTFWAQADCHYTPIKMKRWSHCTAEKKSMIRVLLVHGMNNHPFGMTKGQPFLGDCQTYLCLKEKLSNWNSLDEQQRVTFKNRAIDSQFTYFIPILAAQLGAKLEDTAAITFEILPDHDAGKAVGYLFTRTFFRDGTGEPAVKFYVVNWAVAAAPLKEHQFGAWGNLADGGNSQGDLPSGVAGDFDPELNKHRAYLNKNLKINTIDWGLADASLYMSPVGDKFLQVVRTGMQRITSDFHSNDRVAIVSASLGSTITLDAATDFLDTFLFTSPDPSGESRRQARVAFYMFANQYALLGIGRPRNEVVNPLVKFNARLRAVGARTTVQVYAFTDPNDLLSFPLNPGLDRVSVCNVYVRNPGFSLGIFMHPGDAHVNYEKSKHVIATLMNGPEKVPVRPPYCD